MTCSSACDLTGLVEMDLAEDPDPDEVGCHGMQTAQLGHDHLHVRRVAQFLLGLETKYRISRTAVQGVWDGFTGLAEKQLDDLLHIIKTIVERGGSKEEMMKCIKEIFQKAHPKRQLSELSSCYLRHQFFKNYFHFVAPEKVELPSLHGKPRSGFIVPFAEQLKIVLSLPEMQGRRNTVRPSEMPLLLTDYSDGSYCRSHPLRNNSTFVQVLLAYDDIEIQNPLRSNKCHKMAMFYWTLGNIKPCYRSKLSSIFLLAVTPSRNLKRGGLNSLLADFVSTVTQMKTDGLSLELPDGTVNVKGDLIAVLCDTPAAALMGGFKESTQAHRMCRMCYATKDSFSESFREADFTLRTMDSYLQECELLENNFGTPAAQNYFSKAYGVNNLSVLAEIPDFPVTSNILQDPMHCLLEGALAQTLALLLQQMILYDKLFTLDDLNAFLKSFNYSYVDRRNKPYTIERIHITQGHIKQKAATMLMLSYILPFFLGQHITHLNPHYSHYLTLTKIVHIAFSPSTDGTTAVLLGNLIEEYSQQLTTLYPHDSVKPKCHFIIHFPSASTDFGPLKNQSTMRFEGKHGFFKTQKYHNFVNLPLTMATRHQLHLAFEMTRGDGSLTDKFFSSGDQIKEGSVMQVEHFNDNLQVALANANLGIDQHDMYITPAVTRKGLELKPGVAICLQDDEFDGPTFGVLQIILVSGSRIFLCMQEVDVICFDINFNAYEISVSNCFFVRLWHDSESFWPLPVVKIGARCFITNRQTIYQSF